MKHKLWLYQLPIMGLFVFAFWVFTQGERGELRNPFLLNTVFPSLRTFNGTLTNLKFKLRGPEEPKNSKIVIVEVDEKSIGVFGRWPWPRDITTNLINKIYAAGASAVGLDIVFSEPTQVLSPAGYRALEEQGKLEVAQTLEDANPDNLLMKTIAERSESIVLGWVVNGFCSPSIRASQEECAVDVVSTEEFKEENGSFYPKGFEKFAIKNTKLPENFNLANTSIQSVMETLFNIDKFNDVAELAGYFNANPDPDGYIRRTALFMLMEGKPMPSLALALAKTALKDELSVEIGENGTVSSLSFLKSGRKIPTTPNGVMEVNFRGPSYTFPYVSAHDLLDWDPMSEKTKTIGVHTTSSRSIAHIQSAEADMKSVFKDAIVLVGVSAVGAFDMRAFPFDSNTPGVEGHANILDNLLAGDMLTSTTAGPGYFWILILMTVGAILIAYMTERLDSVKALASFIGAMAILGFIDVYVLFTRNQVNWNTSLLIAQLSAIFIFTISAKYVLEEKSKKFIKGAFSKYVSAAVVDAIVKNPDKLSLGGDKKDLSILFSDIRGFTTLSEKMDPKALTGFLNTYLTDMTKIVFNTKGTLDKYIGDAVMAFWGAPIDMDDHAEQSCEAAIQMQRKLDAERDRFKKEFGINVEVGIGINSGVVSVGNMGSNDNLSYTVIGDDVNLASRLEGLTKYYGVKIVTTRQTIERIEGKGKAPPPHRTLDFVKVKGKKQAVEIIQIMEKEYPAQGLALFTEARGLYAIREWDAAIAKFKSAIEATQAGIGEVDGPSEMYLERCEYFKQNPPAADWDGSWEMTSK